MEENNNPIPYENEKPSEYADRLGIYYTKKVTIDHKKDNGQFFTPTSIANLMASYCDLAPKSIKILDPGCGTAVLSCALIEHIIKQKQTNLIEVVAYETDPSLMPLSTQSFEYLSQWLKDKAIDFKYTLHNSDFILKNSQVLRNENNPTLFDVVKITLFDVIISNPPYFKIAKDDLRTLSAPELVSGQPNIYSLFMGISSKLLKESGELIFITPRSFASGRYFKAFRELFFNSVQLDRVHLFNSRKDTFNRDSVLQETVIVKAINELKSSVKRIAVSSSSGIKDIETPQIKHFYPLELIDLSSNEKILHLPINDKEESVLNLVVTWLNSIANYDIQISTGPVVSFRAWDFIKEENNNNIPLAPLFWLQNVKKMVLEWPLAIKGKGQFIEVQKGTKSLLIPNKNYIFLRRFSTKDDQSRLIASPYFCNYAKSDYIGVENKVNYIYRKNGHLDRSEVAGLCALLNSELFDTYFQIFNGNVNVSATELREMRFPPINDIKEIGNKIILSNDYSMKNVNQTINEFFDLKVILK